MSPPEVRVEEEYSKGVKISRLGSPLLSKLSPLLGGKKGRSVKTRELKACKIIFITKVNFFKKNFSDVYIYVHNDSIVCQANYIIFLSRFTKFFNVFFT